MIRYDMPAAEYKALRAVSAGFLWDIMKPDGCPAQAWHDSVFNKDRPPEEASAALDIGTAAHLAVLQNDLLAERVEFIAARDYRTNAAKDRRDEAIIAGKTPLLAEQFELVLRLRRALEESSAGDLLFGEGRSEVTYQWVHEWSPHWTVTCKARADRIVPGALVDLKTATNASEPAFQREIVRRGHHLRVAWYLDGWNEQDWTERRHAIVTVAPDYLYVVVGKAPPHLVSVFRLDERAIEWGRMLYRRAFAEVRDGFETGQWRSYGAAGEKVNNINLPAWAEHQLADMEAQEGTDV
jgi:hypothetical protein